MVSGNIGIHHRLDGFLLGIAVLVEVIVNHIEGTMTIKAEAEPSVTEAPTVMADIPSNDPLSGDTSSAEAVTPTQESMALQTQDRQTSETAAPSSAEP